MRPIIIVPFALAVGFQLYAAPTLTSSRSLDFSQTMGNNKTNTGSSSINTTTIEPRYSIQYDKSKLSFSADYSLIASKDNENKTDNISHRLNFKSSYKHIPNEWSSSLSVRILQKNLSDTGQLVSSTTTTSNAAESYIVNSLNTARSLHINSNVKLSSSLGLSSQGFKSQTKNDSAKISAQLNVLRILPSVSLSSSINSKKDLDSKDISNTFNLTTSYIINPQLKTFISATQFSGDNKKLSDTRYQLGLNWDVSPISHISLGLGKIGDKDSLSANSYVNLRRFTFNLTHSEEVEPANQTLLNNLNNGNSAFSSSTGNALKYVKNSNFKVTHKTRRLTSSISFSINKQFDDFTLSADRVSNTTSLSFLYQLTQLNTISYSFSDNKIKTTSNNQLKQHSVNWSSKTSRQSSYNVSLDLIEQNNDQSALDSERTQLNFNYRLQF